MPDRHATPNEADALARDRADPLSRHRDLFLLPEGPDGAPAIYLAGQSLGLQPRTAPAAMQLAVRSCHFGSMTPRECSGGSSPAASWPTQLLREAIRAA